MAVATPVTESILTEDGNELDHFPPLGVTVNVVKSAGQILAPNEEANAEITGD